MQGRREPQSPKAEVLGGGVLTQLAGGSSRGLSARCAPLRLPLHEVRPLAGHSSPTQAPPLVKVLHVVGQVRRGANWRPVLSDPRAGLGAFLLPQHRQM